MQWLHVVQRIAASGTVLPRPSESLPFCKASRMPLLFFDSGAPWFHALVLLALH
jgi:hypothetical protein